MLAAYGLVRIVDEVNEVLSANSIWSPPVPAVSVALKVYEVPEHCDSVMFAGVPNEGLITISAPELSVPVQPPAEADTLYVYVAFEVPELVTATDVVGEVTGEDVGVVPPVVVQV